MTIAEAIQKAGVKSMTASEGDTIYKMCYLIYKSYDARYVKALYEVNKRYDWDDIVPGSSIKYLDKKVVDSLTQEW